MATSRPRVLLMSMPWAPVQEPSLGLAILASQLKSAGVHTRVRHGSLFLLEYLKFESYESLGIRYGLNDFLFTSVFEGPEIPSDQLDALEGFWRNTYDVSALSYRSKLDSAQFLDYVRRVRNEAVPRFLDDCLRVVEETRPTMVGFTCMFDQTVASLAMAKVIKEKYPDVLIVLGGYALEAPVGPHIARCFPFVDVVVQGEGEDRIVALAEASLDWRQLTGIDGIDFRDHRGSVISNPRSAVTFNLDDSPFPDYDDYLNDVEELGSKHSVHIDVKTLPVESSRGCWWGQVRHCVFCGIDDETMKYRFKAPEHVERMLEHMSRKYGERRFRFSDYILPRSYYKTLLPRLAAKPVKYELHWEMKSNVKAEEVRLMKEAGIVEVQPGIESFSSAVLRRMDKGVTALQNVLTIRLLTEHDITVNYNVLFGFPDDKPEDYREMLRTIPLLYHLPPPFSYSPVETTRYAPMQADPVRFGISAPVLANRAYDMVFSAAFRKRIGFDLDQYAYMFTRPYEFTPGCADLYDLLVHQILHWTHAQNRQVFQLSCELTDEGVTYRDSRYGPDETVRDFGLIHARVQQLISDRIRSIDELKADLCDVPAARVSDAIDELDAGRLIFREDTRLVGLALPSSYYERLRSASIATKEQLAEA
jgi:ribosomal peptide maturation radical SAM protein 1